MCNAPIYQPPPFSTDGGKLGRNVIPHLLISKEYDLEWLKWALTMPLQETTLRDIRNRIKDIENE